jgi:hypothetical protein
MTAIDTNSLRGFASPAAGRRQAMLEHGERMNPASETFDAVTDEFWSSPQSSSLQVHLVPHEIHE